MRFLKLVLCSIALYVLNSACSTPVPGGKTPESFINFLDSIPVFYDSSLVNVIVEIPAGSNQKWEVNKQTGQLEWERVGDSLRVINYLPYPTNYGMIPRTRLPKEFGGDDDPIDVFILGPALQRGSIYPAKVIGVIKMLDHGEQDDKLIAVDPESWFDHINSIEELKNSFPGITKILVTWLESYKGKGIVEFQGLESVEEAHILLNNAVESYKLEHE